MNYYFFNHSKYNRLYNCSMLNDTEWASYKQPSIFGVFHVILATIYQILYLPFLVVMLKEQFWKYSCYKMMFFLGVTDVCATIIGGTFEGIFAIRGDIFCTNPNFIYLVGCFQVEVWITACCASLLLLVNRSLDLISSNYADLLFSGWKTYIWILFPFGFGLWMCWFTTPYLFSSLLHASFVNPYFGIPGINVTMSDYDDHYCVIFNYVVAVLFPALYVVLCVVLVIRTKGASSSNVVISKIQKQIMIQSIVVSVFLALTSALYMLMQYIPVPMAIIIASQFMWQASHGASVFTYIFINKTLRREAILMFKELVGANAIRIDPANPRSVHINPNWLGRSGGTAATVGTQDVDFLNPFWPTTRRDVGHAFELNFSIDTLKKLL